MMDQAVNTYGWLKSPSFDVFFIFGIPLLALSVGAFVGVYPSLVTTVVLLNIWLLGYHHVISTFTRLCFDRESFQRSKYLIFHTFFAVLAVVCALSWYFGLWILTSVYLYAQWFHYSRQSWGISRAYERNAPSGYVADRSWLTQAAFYIFPVWGILNRSHQDPGAFLGIELKVVPVSYEVLWGVAALAVALFAVWCVKILNQWRKGVLPKAYTFFMLSHFAVFYVGYIAMPDIDQGWLVANVWHNLQYIAFVWLFNNKRYKNGVDENAKFLSVISQSKNVVTYFVVCLVLTLVIYGTLQSALDNIFIIVPLVVVYQTINFHHYVVDAVIWRSSWIRGRVFLKQ